MKIFSIYDDKVEAYLSPITAPTTAAAVRMFETAANDESHDFHKHAGDYTLYEIGLFDEEHGTIMPLDPRKSLGTALEHRNFTPTLAVARTETAS